ncbi:MAG TPA: hypothetical protein PK772_06960, partial [Chitinophagaceae bacterium]|nr:hypothetical protein [Chitinophagaceae bacterium]
MEDNIKNLSNIQLMQYWGDQYHEIDKEKIKEVCEENKIRYQFLPQSYFGVTNRWNSKDFDDLKNPVSSHDIFEQYVFEPAQANFDNLLIVKYILKTKATKIKIEGDITIDRWFKTKQYNPKNEYYFFHGDVHIIGNLNFDMHMYITGNLTVDGIIQDTEEWTPLLVGGNIKAGGIEMGAKIFCAGEIVTPLLCIDGTGEILVGQEVKSKLLVEDGNEHHINGQLNLQHHIDFNEDNNLALQELEKLMIPEIITKLKKSSKKIAKELGDEGCGEGDGIFYFDKSILFDYMRKGKNIWK